VWQSGGQTDRRSEGRTCRLWPEWANIIPTHTLQPSPISARLQVCNISVLPSTVLSIIRLYGMVDCLFSGWSVESDVIDRRIHVTCDVTTDAINDHHHGVYIWVSVDFSRRNTAASLCLSIAYNWHHLYLLLARLLHNNNKKAELSQRNAKDDRAKKAARCSLTIFGSPWLRPQLLFPKFLMGFCSVFCAYKIWSS